MSFHWDNISLWLETEGAQRDDLVDDFQLTSLGKNIRMERDSKHWNRWS